MMSLKYDDIEPSDEDEVSEFDSTFESFQSSSCSSVSEYRWPPCLEIEEIDEGWIRFSRTSSSQSSISSLLLNKSHVYPQPRRLNWMKKLFGTSGIVDKPNPITSVVEQLIPSNMDGSVERPFDHRGYEFPFKEFTTKELRKATNNYSEDRILGRGICSTVYKGILQDKTEVAVKKFRAIRENRSFEFANEIYFLSKTDHVNVVKLLGWCSEIEVPILVLEYIPNGMLFDFLHTKRDEFTMLPLNFRLRVAAEIADALTYLHEEASPTVIHGNLKSLTILLDANYTVKVYSFGISILESDSEDGHTTHLRDNQGYLDPEYYQSGKLTDRSDVYSFGVVLLELLTRKTAIYYSGKYGKYRKLAESFVDCTRENRLMDILDLEITTEGLTEQLLKVTNLATHCLRQKGSERPAMKEVQKELEASRVSTTTHASVPGYQREPTVGDSPH